MLNIVFWHGISSLVIISNKFKVSKMMKDIRFLTVVAFMMFFMAGTVSAQNNEELAITTEKKGAFNESADESDEIIEDEIAHYYRQHKKLPSFFSGYVIELTTSDLPLRRDYVLFEKFGNVMIDQLEEGGFSYIIQGFKNEKAATSFLNNIVIYNASEAKVVLYEKGRRGTKK
ncbi:MAG: hypothetical protein ACI94Y_001616 [Maribacter sp.]|jgi:hypothetical protein